MSRKGKEKNVTEGSLRNGHHAFPTSGELPYGSSSLYIHALLYILCKCACWFSVQFTQSRSDLTNEVKPGPDKTVSGHTPCLCQPCPATSSSPGLGSVHPTALLCSGQCEPAAGILTTWEVPFSCLWQWISLHKLQSPWGDYICIIFREEYILTPSIPSRSLDQAVPNIYTSPHSGPHTRPPKRVRKVSPCLLFIFKLQEKMPFLYTQCVW